jgi:uncharacterized membrane protein
MVDVNCAVCFLFVILDKVDKDATGMFWEMATEKRFYGSTSSMTHAASLVSQSFSAHDTFFVGLVRRVLKLVVIIILAWKIKTYWYIKTISLHGNHHEGYGR